MGALMPIDWEALALAGEDELVTLGQVFSGLAIEGGGDEELAIRQLRVRLSNATIAPAPAPPPTPPPFRFSHAFLIDLPEPTEATEAIRGRCAECMDCPCLPCALTFALLCRLLDYPVRARTVRLYDSVGRLGPGA